MALGTTERMFRDTFPCSATRTQSACGNSVPLTRSSLDEGISLGWRAATTVHNEATDLQNTRECGTLFVLFRWQYPARLYVRDVGV